MTGGDLRVAVVGDIVLQVPGMTGMFGPSAAALSAADVAIGQIEVPYTRHKEVAALSVPSPGAEPDSLREAAAAGITVGTGAGNHIFDCGTQGVLDTIDACRQAGIEPVGIGANLEEARRPAIVDNGSRKVGILDYNCVGPRESWASSRKAGSAYVKILTHYDLDDANPGDKPKTYTFAAPESVDEMRADIAKLRTEVDLVIVVLHKGIGHTPVTILQYEIDLAHAAVDAGAHAVVGHHSHIMRGIEVYNGAPIFHGIGNFVTVTNVLTPGNNVNGDELEAWARRRRELYGFTPDPSMPFYPFHPESRNTAIALIDIVDGNVVGGLIPCWIDEGARPVPVAAESDPGVLEYISRITREAGFSTRFEWESGVVRVSS